MKRRLKLLDDSKVGGPVSTGDDPPREEEPGNDGFSLKFAQGRGVLSLKDQTALPALTVNSLEMTIPKIAFPFDVSSGVRGLRDRRHDLRRLSITIRLDQLTDLVKSRLERLNWVDNPRIKLEKECACVLLDYGPEDGRIPFSFRLVPSVGDRHPSLIVDDMRAYGPMPMGLLVVALSVLREVTGAKLEGVEFRPPDPVKGVLLSLMPGRGWRIPDYSRVGLDRFELMSDRALMEFRSLEELEDEVKSSGDDEGMKHLRRLEELRLTREGDRSLALGDMDQARGSFAHLLDREPDSAVATARLAMLDVMDPQLRDTARVLLSEALARSPERSDLNAVAAHAGALDGDVDAEIAALEKLFESGLPLERLAAGLRIGTLLRDRDPERAIRFFEGALAARRENPESIFSLIEIGATMGKADMVERLIPRWIAVHRSPSARAGAHRKVGELLLRRMNDPGGAVKHFERASLADPSDMVSSWGLADALAGMGDHRRAISRYERLEKKNLESGNVDGARRAMVSIGEIWMERGEPDLAAPRFREAIGVGDATADLYANLSRTNAQLGQYPEAAAALEEALHHSSPEDPDFDWVGSALELARIHLEELRDPVGAEPWIKAASRHGGGEDRALSLMANLLERQEDWTGLTRVLEKSLVSDPTVDNVLALADARLRAGEFRSALSTLETAMARHPERMDLLDAFIEAARGSKDKSKLRKALRNRYETCTDATRRAAISTELGELELKVFEHPQESVDWFRRALEDDSTAVQARAGLVDGLRRLGKEEELEGHLEILAASLRDDGRRGDAAAVTVQRAEMIARRGDVQGAADLWREVLPDLTGAQRHGALLNMAGLFLEADDPSSARDLFVAARKEPQAAETYTAALGEAEAALQLGDHEAALEAATQAGSGPGELRARSTRAASRALVHLGRSREAARLLERVAENVDEAEATELLLIGAQILRHEVRDLSRARDLFERLLEIDPSHQRGQAALIDLLETSGDRAELARGLTRFVGDDEAGMADLRRAADFFSAEGLHDEAAGALRQALEMEPDSETARMLAGALKRCGEVEEMLSVLRRFAGDDERVRSQLADQLEQLGRHGELAQILGTMAGKDEDQELERLIRLATTRAEHLGETREAVENLLSALDLSSDVERKRTIGRSAFEIAERTGDAELITRCIEKRIDSEEPARKRELLFELVGIKCSQNDVETAQKVLDAGLAVKAGGYQELVEVARRHAGCAMLSASAARESVRAQDWTVAEEMLTLTLASSEDDEQVPFLRRRAAIRRARLGDHSGAIEDMVAARGIEELPTPEIEELVDLLEESGDLERAAQTALDLAQTMGWEVARVVRAAELFEKVGALDRARDLWRRAVAINPDPSCVVSLVKLLDPSVHGEELDRLLENLKGREDLLDIPDHLILLEVGVDLDLSRGQELEAVEGLAAMMDLDPGRRDPWQKMVHILERRGEWQALVKRMEERLTLAAAPEDVARTAMALGRLLEEKLGDEDGAVATFERVIAVRPDHPGANMALANIAYRRRNWELLERYIGALEEMEWSAEVELWRARAAEHFGRVDEAVAIFREIISRAGPTPQAVEGLARLVRDGSCDEEIVALGESLIEVGGQESVKSLVHRRMGLAHMRMGNRDKARQLLEYADKLSGGDPETLELLARLHGEGSRFQEQAEILCRLAYTFEGEQRAVHLVEAAAIYIEKLYEVKRAYHWLNRAADVAPDLPGVLLGLADCAWLLDEKHVVAHSLERYRLVEPSKPLGPSRNYHFAASLAHTHEWPAADIIELLDSSIPYLDAEERTDAEELLVSLKGQVG